MAFDAHERARHSARMSACSTVHSQIEYKQNWYRKINRGHNSRVDLDSHTDGEANKMKSSWNTQIGEASFTQKEDE